MMKTIIGLAVLSLLLFSNAADADTIYLKDGKKVVGDIYEENSYQVRIRIGKFPRIIMRNKIEKIVKQRKKDRFAADIDTTNAFGNDGISEQEKQLVFRLLVANGTRESVEIMFSELFGKVPVDGREEFQELLNPDRVMEKLVPLYGDYYSEQEIKDLVNFYKSPTGIKHIKMAPVLMKQSLERIADYLKEEASDEFYSSKRSIIIPDLRDVILPDLKDLTAPGM